jgi:hypothetical protein
VSEKLREAAELFAKLSRDAGRELTWDEEGVAWADTYVQAVRPVESEDQLRVHSALVGAFLGEALIASFGGRWVDDAGEWAVQMDRGDRLHPFRRTMEQLRDGEGSSILALFRSVAASAEDASGETGEADAPVEADSTDAANASTGPGSKPAMTEAEGAAQLRTVAGRFLEVVVANGGPAEYGPGLVAFVASFVEAARPVGDELMDHYATMVGALLGESIVATYGGGWAIGPGGWAVRFAPGHEVYPFQAARRHLEKGAEDSVLALFDSIPLAHGAVLAHGGRQERP